ncbi:hypothetical protein MCOR09_010844 [Pyricularia oryzae]|nr:hypothetical protein MCOR09_010844 [Pyricularia oryzae]
MVICREQQCRRVGTGLTEWMVFLVSQHAQANKRQSIKLLLLSQQPESSQSWQCNLNTRTRQCGI